MSEATGGWAEQGVALPASFSPECFSEVFLELFFKIW